MSSFNHLKIKIGVSEHKNLQNTIQKVGEMSNFSLGLKGKLIGKALINETSFVFGAVKRMSRGMCSI